jgi:hypothetical protein
MPRISPPRPTIDFAALMEPVALKLLGESNAGLSKPPKDVRFGEREYARSLQSSCRSRSCGLYQAHLSVCPLADGCLKAACRRFHHNS